MTNDAKAIWETNRLEAGAEGAGPGLAEPRFVAASSASPPTLVFDEVVSELRRFIWNIVRDSAQVDDVIQATYLKAVEKGAAAHPETARGWLFRVAYREALIIKRREALQTKTHAKLSHLPPRASLQPEEELLRSETVAAVRLAIRTLSEPQRRVVLARMHGNQTFAQIASESGLPLGTVLTHMRRALEKLRRVLDLGD